MAQQQIKTERMLVFEEPEKQEVRKRWNWKESKNQVDGVLAVQGQYQAAQGQYQAAQGQYQAAQVL